jgi:NTP pyrophosphatase (non-canonical NTP hydrolase)
MTKEAITDRAVLDLDILRDANVRRCEKSFHSVEGWSESDWACAAAGEMGEICDAIKKRRRGWDKPGVASPTVDDVGKEIADTICYLDLLAAKMGIDLSEAVRQKFNEVSDRVGSDIRL